MHDMPMSHALPVLRVQLMNIDGQTEVAELRAHVLRQINIANLDVAMHHAVRFHQMLHGVGHFSNVHAHFVRRESAATAEQLEQ